MLNNHTFHNDELNDNAIYLLENLFRFSSDKDSFNHTFVPPLIEGMKIGDEITTIPQNMFSARDDITTLAYPVSVYSNEFNNERSYYCIQLGIALGIEKDVDKACMLFDKSNGCMTGKDIAEDVVKFLEGKDPYRTLADYTWKTRMLLGFKPHSL